jgi:ribosomal protein L7/L12
MVLLLGLAAIGVLVVVVSVLVLAGRQGVEVVSLTPSPPGQLGADATPEQLVRAGRKIEAIKKYRELTGLGLRDAKDAIEAYEREGTLSLPSKSSLLRQVHDSEIEQQIRSGHLIDAIKLYREKNGVGLKEAKDAVEAWRNRMRAS